MDKCTRKSRREEGWGDRVILFLLDYVFSCFKDMTLLQKSSSIDMNEYTKEETNMSITLNSYPQQCFVGLIIFYRIFPTFRLNVGNIMHNNASHTKQCYGS